IAERGRCDLVRDVAVPLPLYIIAEMLGIRREDFDRFHSWSDRLIGISGNYHDPVKVNESVTAFMEYGNYLQDVFEERRREPREDLMTILLVAGNETTRNAISGGMLALMQNREQLELLRSRPDLLDCAAEEILRYVSPIICFRRTTTRDTEVRGQAIRAGERVAMLYQSANRDDDVYAEPDRFDVTRQPNPHLAFGIGPHFCLGANLA